MFLLECEKQQFNGSTYGDLILYTHKLQSKYRICSKQIDEIRTWSNQK